MKQVDIAIGARFGRWAVVAESGRDERGQRQFECLCDCGNRAVVFLGTLRNGRSQSCGCGRRRNYKHGSTGTPEHRCWTSARGRCRNPRNAAFADYGGRGITICARWSDFAAFLADMGPRPAGTSLDRIDVDGPYSPENCRWATASQQANNTRTNVRVSVNGEERTLAEWARVAGIPTGLMWARIIKLGWSPERAVTEPLRGSAA